MIAESRVSREINDAVRSFDHISAPQSPVAIEEPSRRKMQRRHAVNGSYSKWQRFAPIQFMGGADAMGLKQPPHPGRNNELGISALRQPAQGRDIQVIVVIVAEKHDID